MKMAAKKSVIEIEDDDDDDETFFSLAVAAEADALASKRRRITQPSGPIAVAAVPNPVSDSHVNDGLYTAALKGNHGLGLPRAAGNEHVAGGGGGSCFKCGKPGHWARDCDSGGGGGQFGSFGSGTVGPSVAEKSCPCGSGICLVLTANTEKNPGRKFYKCPLRQENGGCGFFEWCDSASGANSMAGGSRRSDSSSLPVPGLDCPIGQQFNRCPSNQGSSCGFFKSCNENTQSPGLPVTASKAYGNSTDTYNTNYTTRTSSSSCFKCGKEGHWARDCSAPSSNPPPQLGGGSASCYKCGKPGHWSRDCTFT